MIDTKPYTKTIVTLCKSFCFFLRVAHPQPKLHTMCSAFFLLFVFALSFLSTSAAGMVTIPKLMCTTGRVCNNTWIWLCLTWPVAGSTSFKGRNRHITTSKMIFLVTMVDFHLHVCQLHVSWPSDGRWRASTLVSQRMAICNESTVHIDDMWHMATCDSEQGRITFKCQMRHTLLRSGAPNRFATFQASQDA